MTDFSRKRKAVDNEKRGVIAQWGIPLVILFIVVIILVSNFSVISRNSAKESVNKKFINECATYANAVTSTMTEMTFAGQSAAAIIGNDDNSDGNTWKKYAELIKGSIPAPYLIAIVNMDGQGATNFSSSIDISQQEYYVEARTQKYIFTENDGILGKPAFISVVPIYRNRTVSGMIYLYASADEIEKKLPIGDYDGYPSFAVIGINGNILLKAGEDSYYTQNSNFIDNLRTATLSDLSFSKITMRIGKQIRFAFSTQKNNEEKTIISVPLGIGEWELITVLNQEYVNIMQRNEWKNARDMVTNLSIAVFIFLGLIIILAIINKLKYNQQNKDLADKADTDLLTDLSNKMATERKIQEFMEENPDAQCLMFLLDIDNFKKINDTMGHAFGDEVLRSLGMQLRNEFRVTDIIGRTGGDEFILFLKHIKSNEQIEKEGTRVSGFFHQFKAGEYVKYSATASIGAAVFPRDARDFQSLYRAADSALYEAKRRGKNQLVFYSKNLDILADEKRKEVPIDSDNLLKK